MEYTKDMVLNVRCKRKIGVSKFKIWTSKLKRNIMNNKMILVTLSLLVILMTIDFVLINSFMKLLTNVY